MIALTLFLAFVCGVAAQCHDLLGPNGFSVLSGANIIAGTVPNLAIPGSPQCVHMDPLDISNLQNIVITGHMTDWPTTGAQTNLTCAVPPQIALGIALGTLPPSQVALQCRDPTNVVLFAIANMVVTGPTGLTAVLPDLVRCRWPTCAALSCRVLISFFSLCQP